jgi:peptidoglycan/LPS O-acetylase OafA/YrhL
MVFMFAAPSRAPWAVRRLSDISYSLYLLHIPLGMLTIDWAVKSGARFTLAFVLGVAVSVAAAAISYRWVEQPAQKFARRLTKRSHSSRSRVQEEQSA